MIKYFSTVLGVLILFLITVGPNSYLKADSVPLPPKNPLRMSSTPDGQTSQSQEKDETRELEQWSSDEIDLAHQTCAALLSKLSLKFEPVVPIRKGKCGAPAPIKVTAIGSQTSQVLLAPYAIVNCPMIAAIDRWLKIVVQPAARKIFNDRVTEVKVVAHYACRRRYGNPNKRMSEHAYANAIDISALKFENKNWLSVLDGWGPTERDIQKQITAMQEKEVEKKRQNKVQTGEQNSTSSSDKSSTTEVRTSQITNGKMSTAGNLKKKDKLSAEKSENDAKTKGKSENSSKPVKYKRPELDTRAVFLRRIHKRACGLFGTVLGPEANDAHKDHFHLDLAPRRRSAYCE